MQNIFTIFILSLLAIGAEARVSLGFKGEESASVGIYVKDINTDEIIAANCASKAILPASVMKAVTAATVYSTMDTAYRFETKVYLTGPVHDGICEGNLVIVSVADPTIDSENFSDLLRFSDEIAEALTAVGITEIKGGIVVEETLSDAGVIPGWEVEDVPWSYGAGLYGFNYRDNTFALWPATKKTDPFVPNLNVTVRTGKGTDLKRGIDSDNLIVYGSKPKDVSWRVNTTMNHPAPVFAHELKTTLEKSEIKVGTEIDDAGYDRTLLFTHKSAPLPEILEQTLIYSHNLFAEGILRLLAPGESRDKAIERETQIWAERGLMTDFNAIFDGSGLSRADRLKPTFIGDVLEWMAESEYCDGYVSLFPMVGQEGTVKTFLKDTPLDGRMVLKTGSMNAVQCYAGYKLDDEGDPTHVVVILVNGFYCDRASLRKSIEKFLLNTFENL